MKNRHNLIKDIKKIVISDGEVASKPYIKQDKEEVEADNPETDKSQPKKKSKTTSQQPWYKRKRIIIPTSIITFIILLIGALAGITLNIGNQIKTELLKTRFHAAQSYEALKGQDLNTAKDQLQQTIDSLSKAQSDYSRLRFWLYSPLKWHYQDGQELFRIGFASTAIGTTVINAIEPYADILGFTGEESFMDGTAEERIVKVIETLDLIAPKLEQIQQNIVTIDAAMNKIDPVRYPISLDTQQGAFQLLAQCTDNVYTEGTHTVGELIDLASQCAHQVNLMVADYKPVIEALPSVAGSPEPKTYLVLFQNDGELRPTGGFLTAYAVLTMESGKVTPERSDDIYELDAKFRAKPEAPAPIKKYLPTVLVWNLRDMNLSPDFKVSMDTFVEHYQTVPGEAEIDGIIAVDTNVLVRLIEVLGPVEVPGYGTFTAENEPRCDCPQVVYSLENMITRPTPYHRSDRKGVLGPLMQTILAKAYGAPKQVWPGLFQSVFDLIEQKHVLFYFLDEDTQKAAETINVAGRITDQSVDYLHINDTNFGGAKSNMFVSQEVDQEISFEEGVVTHTINIMYKNPRPADNCNLEAGELCLNGVLPNWLRLYIPKGSELIEVRGVKEDSVEVTEDLDKTVIEGFFTLNPQAQARVTIIYQSAYQPQDGIYRQFIQKQPGKDAPQYTVTFFDQREEFELLTDREVVFEL